MLDELLASVGSLAVGLRESNVIERWFFIRFWDPVPHIRLRFRGKPQRLRSRGLAGAAGHGRARSRPRASSIGFDSKHMFLKLTATEGQKLLMRRRPFSKRTAQWPWRSCNWTGAEEISASVRLLWPATHFSATFTLDAAGREVFATERATDLSAETHIERVPIGRLFRELRSELESLVGSSPELLPAPLREARSVIAARSPAAAKYYGWCRGLEAEGKLTSPLRSILASLIHMQLFRLARVAPPLLELVYLRRPSAPLPCRARDGSTDVNHLDAVIIGAGCAGLLVFEQLTSVGLKRGVAGGRPESDQRPSSPK